MGARRSDQPPGWLRRLAEYCLRHRFDVILAFGAALLGSVVAALIPLVVRHVVDDVVAAHHGAVTPWVVVLVGAGVLRFAFGFVRRYTAGRLSLDVQYDMRNDIFTSLQRLDGARQDELQTGQVVSRSISDVTLVQGLLSFLPMLVGSVLLFIASLVVMAVLSPLLTLVALAAAPALWLVSLRSRRDLFPANWDAQQQAGRVAATVEAAVTGVRVVKGYGQEERELGGLEKKATRLFATRMRAVRLTSRYNPALQAIPALGQVAVLAFGGYLAMHGRISLGTFLAFSSYLAGLVGPVRMLSGLLTFGQQARAGLERVLEVVDARPRIADRPGALELPAGPARVVLENVTFGYGDAAPVLDGVTLSIEPGQTLALVGGAGSGKSTVSLLLPRFYDVRGGAVCVGGHDVRDVTLDSLRQRIGVVFEESFLFSDSVRANISFGRPDASDEQVRAAARAAQAEGFIERLPGGYDTVVGEQGLTLSGGQRQRVALARALLADPQVLLLDDATSAVDARVEAEIYATLREVMRGRTTLLVAHRRSTLSLADRIAVLDAGRVVDVGTEDELEQRCVLFRRLMNGPDAEAALPEDPDAEQQSDGITPSLWRYEAAPTGDPLAAVTPPPATEVGFLGGVPPNPALLASVAALPPATDEPSVPATIARTPDPAFTLGRLLRPFRLPLTIGLVLVALDAVAQLLLPALVRRGIDSGVRSQTLGALMVISAVALAVVLADWLVGIAQLRVTGRTGERLLYALRVKTFAQLQRLGLDFYERELGGRIMTRMTTDVDALSTFLQTGLVTAIVSLLSVVGVVVALVILDAGLALSLLAVVPVLVVATLWFRARSTPAYGEARERVSVVNAQLQENVAGVRVAQAYRREAHNAQAFRDAAFAYRASRLRAQRYIATYFPFVEFLSEVAAAVVLAVGAARVRDGSLTPGVLIAALLYVDLFFSPVQQLSQVFDGYQQASVGLRRLRDLLRTPTSTPAADRPLPVPPLRGEVVLADVSFRYAGAERDALSDIALRVAPGETVALVGETGAGKSTVVKLVARFYDPTSGAVCVDGNDLRTLDLPGYRRHLGVVPQEAFLSAGTVRDAIAYGRPGASDAEVEAAARAVGAHAMIAGLRGGYLHPVGERGRGLSAGQRQLLALARAELVQPDILLLDEATAALDLSAEAAVTHAAAAVTSSRTTLVVAHRLTTASRADRIVVLAGGRIIEVGAHDELLAAGGAYARLWAAFSGTSEYDTADAADDLLPAAAPLPLAS